MAISKFSTHGYTFVSADDGGKVIGSCFHCGSAIRYFAAFKNDATDEIVKVGLTCFTNATPAQKREINWVKRAATAARKTEKFLTTDPIGQRLAAYCATHEKSEDKESSNWMLFLKLQHLAQDGRFNNGEYALVEKHLDLVGA